MVQKGGFVRGQRHTGATSRRPTHPCVAMVVHVRPCSAVTLVMYQADGHTYSNTVIPHTYWYMFNMLVMPNGLWEQHRLPETLLEMGNA